MLGGNRQAGLSGAALQRMQKSIEMHLHSEDLVGNSPAATPRPGKEVIRGALVWVF